MEDYEILPHQLLSDLKYDVEALKKKLQEPDTKINELILEIETMKDSIHELNDIFSRALENTKESTQESSSVDKLMPILNSIVKQNETIAQGMLSIIDKLDQQASKQTNTEVPPPQQLPQQPERKAGFFK